uniref:Amino acid transporter transmembrane domain-containing protein n=1 Tax=Spongospora subterranea TaxID=70186 RepID=A0A0H5QMU4_9EUKA|eukprot:CRZ03495.1 hypothetical protein [Spongospora subterranea]
MTRQRRCIMSVLILYCLIRQGYSKGSFIISSFAIPVPFYDDTNLVKDLIDSAHQCSYIQMLMKLAFEVVSGIYLVLGLSTLTHTPDSDAAHKQLTHNPNIQDINAKDVVHDQLIPSNQHTNDTDIDHDPSFHSEFELQSMTEDALSCSELRVLGSSSDTDILLDQSSSKPVIESEPSPITHSSAVSDSSNLTNHNLIASSLLSTPDHSSSQSSHLRPSIGAVIALSSMCSVAILSSIALYTMSIWIASQHRIRGVPHDPLPVEII